MLDAPKQMLSSATYRHVYFQLDETHRLPSCSTECPVSMLLNAFCSEQQNMLNTAGMRNCTAKRDSAPTYRCRRGTNLAKACFCNAAAAAAAYATATASMCYDASANVCDFFAARLLNA